MHSQALPDSVVREGSPATVFTLNDKRALNRGFGDGMSRAFELVVTPALFAGIGFLADRALGTGPWLLVAFAAFGVVGTFLRAWYGYDAEMRTHEGRFTPGAGMDADAGTEAVAGEDVAPADLWSQRKGTA